MALPVRPPLRPMLARLARELPDAGDRRFVYEPKWDGFRCLAFRDGDEVDLRSRHDRPFSRYFPELVEAIRELGTDRFVLDGEIVLVREGRFDFEALMSRLHPAASRVQRLASEMPARFVAFDLLAEGDEDLRDTRFGERRERLERLLTAAPPRVVLTPVTSDPTEAAGWLRRYRGGGIDGVVAKAVDLTYQPGKRAMLKVKTLRTVDCVVAGYRPFVDTPALSSLLLGLYDDAGALHHVGVVQAFTDRERVELIDELAPLRIPLEQHPWASGFLIGRSPMGRLKGSAARWTPEMEHDWVPLRPERVVEVAFDQVDGTRFRHPARLVRWRPDREARSCLLEQLETPAPDLPEVVATG
ncbi:MAG: ATP-dependent DNA ligase [Actinomycetota bacterium]